MQKNLARKLEDLEPKVSTSPWEGYEHYKGYAVMSLPFSSGYVLGLRVFPENDFAPYSSVWIRSPEGDWSIYNDGPSLKTSCPRLWGPSLKHTDLTKININWTDKNELEIEMEKPRLVWNMTIVATPLVDVLNAMNSNMPLWTWKHRPMRAMREDISKRLLKMGDLRFSFVTPNEQETIFISEEVFFITSSKALLEGEDLGHPIHLENTPEIGEVPLPKRPSFVIGRAHVAINDANEYQQTKEYVASL